MIRSVHLNYLNDSLDDIETRTKAEDEASGYSGRALPKRDGMETYTGQHVHLMLMLYDMLGYYKSLACTAEKPEERNLATTNLERTLKLADRYSLFNIPQAEQRRDEVQSFLNGDSDYYEVYEFYFLNRDSNRCEANGNCGVKKDGISNKRPLLRNIFRKLILS